MGSEGSGDGPRDERIAALGFDPSSREQVAVTECNLCGSAVHAEVARRDRYGYSSTLRVCTRCGLGFLSPRLSEAEYADFYASIYRPLVSAFHGRRIDAETVQGEQREYAAELAAFVGGVRHDAPSSIIDVGGSTGVVGAGLRDAFGGSLTVLDPAEDELAVAEAAGAETIVGFAENYDPAGRTWDLVLLCQTIDHLLDARGTVMALRGMIAPGGHAFIDVLDLRYALRRTGRIEGASKIDHPYYFTRATALACFQGSGLEVTAERLSDDGHLGFLLSAGEEREPDWATLGADAVDLLDEIWSLRAGGDA